MGIFDMDNAEFSSTYAEEAAMVDASELIANALERSAMTGRELAAALGIGEADVTACLAGEKDMGVKQLAKALHIMGEGLVLKSSIPKVR